MRCWNTTWAAGLLCATLTFALLACESAGSEPGADAAVGGDTLAADAAVGGDTLATDAGGGGTGPFACGQSLECQPTEACKGRWPGVCGGDPPGPGGCGPSCQATLCGDGTFCICLSFECVALPPDCRDCACALDAVPEWEKGACTGEEVDGAPPLECMGA